MKTGRNELCPCGSGKKFKKCCLGLERTQADPALRTAPPGLVQRAQEARRLCEAKEDVRRQQQGHGRPIISIEDHGYRLVAVSNRIYWDKNWLVFPDFLLSFMKQTLGPEWGARERTKSEHPVFRWLEKFKRLKDSLPVPGKVQSGQMVGFMACWLHLAYALYLIAHNDEVPKKLLKRLRDPSTFMPAYYEAIVGAALAVAGFEISSAEKKATSTPTPEFRVRSKATGRIYELEAKRKDRWKAATDDVSSADFQRELESYVRDQVYSASKKKLTNPVFWFELSIPTAHSEPDWRAIGAKVKSVLRDVEVNMTVEGEPIGRAFVVVTNHTFLANEDIEGQPSAAFLETLKIEDYPIGRPMEIDAVLEAYDKYRDIFWMTEAWKIARAIPVTFDGSPPELLSPDGKSQKTVMVGDMLLVSDEDGKAVPMRVEEIASMGEEAIVIVHDAVADRKLFVQFPLSQGEASAAARYTDAIFGKVNAGRRLRDDNPFDLYDWNLKMCSRMTPEQIAKALDASDHLRQFKSLPLSEARIRIAREYTKAFWAKLEKIPGFADKP